MDPNPSPLVRWWSRERASQHFSGVLPLSLQTPPPPKHSRVDSHQLCRQQSQNLLRWANVLKMDAVSFILEFLLSTSRC